VAAAPLAALAIESRATVATAEGSGGLGDEVEKHGALSISLSIFSNNASECSWAKVLMRRKLRFPLY